jgi:hypothetical protein
MGRGKQTGKGNTDRDTSGSKVTIDQSKNKRFSVIGPLDNGEYAAWDHHDGEEVGKGTRDEMNDKIGGFAEGQ